MRITSNLRNRIDIYGRNPIENELGEEDLVYGKIKTVWAEILPQTGRERSGQGNTVYSEITHRIRARLGAIPSLSNDMYFMFKGQRYDVMYFNPNYMSRDIIEIFCKLVVE